MKGIVAGVVVDETYRVLAPLGAGGMGEVYRALDLGRGVEVALKILPPDLEDDPDALARFQREAELAARVGSAGGVVRVHAFGRFAGAPYCVMELARGGSLDDRLREGIEEDRLLEVVEALARTLARCHAQGIVHRDVKPANVLFNEQGAALLCDFGLALDLRVRDRLTLSQELLGTPCFMAPEQAESVLEAGAPVDVYALGAILYRGLSGQLPYTGAPLAVLDQLLRGSPTPLAQHGPVATELEALVERAMQRDPDERCTAEQLADWIGRYRRGESTGLALPQKRTRLLAGAAIALALGLGLALGTGYLIRARAQRAEVEAAAELARGLTARDLLRGLPDERRAEAEKALELLRSRVPEQDRADDPSLSRLAAWELMASSRAGGAPQRIRRDVAPRLRLAQAYSQLDSERPRPVLDAVVAHLGSEDEDVAALARGVGAALRRRVELSALELAGRPESGRAPVAALEGALEIPLLPDEEAELARAKRAILARDAGAWGERLRREVPSVTAKPSPTLRALDAALSFGLRVQPPRALLAQAEAWLASIVAWAGSDDRGRGFVVALRSQELFDLAPEAWREPPLVVSYLNTWSHHKASVTTPESLLTLLRFPGVDVIRNLPHRLGTTPPAAEWPALESRLRERYPHSQALAFWGFLQAMNAARTTPKAASTSEQARVHRESVGRLLAYLRVALSGERRDLHGDYVAELFTDFAKSVLRPPTGIKAHPPHLEEVARLLPLARARVVSNLRPLSLTYALEGALALQRKTATPRSLEALLEVSRAALAARLEQLTGYERKRCNDVPFLHEVEFLELFKRARYRELILARFPDGLAALERLRASDGRTDRALDKLRDLHLFRIDALIALERFDEARAVALKVEEVCASSSEFAMLAAQLYGRFKDEEGALRVLNRRLAATSHDPTVRGARDRILRRAERRARRAEEE